MKKMLCKYKNPNVERFNYKLMNREYDKSIYEYIENSCKSLEIFDFIEYEGYSLNEDESTIDRSKYIYRRNVPKKEKHFRYRYMADSNIAEMILKFKISYRGEEVYIRKPILVPVPDDDGYFLINGTRYFLTYQLVDNSTYNTPNSVNLKSMMAVSIKRETACYKSITGEIYEAPVYTIKVYAKYIDILSFYFAKVGMANTLKFFSVDKLITFTSEEAREDRIYFAINKGLFLSVDRHFFEKHIYVKSIVFMILRLTTNRTKIENIMTKSYWLEKLGSYSNTKKYNFEEKGNSSLMYFERLIDETTKDTLRIDRCHKKNTYSIVRWMIQNYSELRKKDNIDLDNKRLRCNEYIAYLLTMAFSDRCNRIVGSKLSKEKILEIFKFPGEILIKQLHGSGLLRYDDHVNDMDMFSKLKYTIKGPTSLGNKNDRKISIVYRSTPPSYIGKIDINVCGNSDPGTSGVITPFAKTDGLYFSDKTEPERFKFDFDKEINDISKKNGDIIVDFETLEDYYTTLNQLDTVMENVYITRRSEELIVHIPDDVDDDMI